jgi:7-carboxy-7-deazaguanine synthase
MRIAEIFYSIQGEGEWIGMPSIFIRTSGCNLRCAWCDTPYASWKPEGEEMSVAEILLEVSKYPARFVVLTGGEPMIAAGIRELATQLRALGKHITIETAGTVPPGGIACDLASLSPKLANSKPEDGTIDAAWIARHEATRLRPDVLHEWVVAYKYQLKFVISEAKQLEEIQALLKTMDIAIPPERIQLMPEGRTTPELRQKAGWLLEICKRTGYRFSPRLHIDLFGNTRGT